MQNNDFLRKLRYALDFKDGDMVSIFNAGKEMISEEVVVNMLKKDDFPHFVACSDTQLERFLDGLITVKRGAKPETASEGVKAEAVKREKLNNNIIFKKLKIALELQSDDIHLILKLAEMPISKSELSAVFRAPGHRNFKECGDKYMRNFLKGLAIYRK